MTARSFVVARGEGDEREYFAGVQGGMYLATSPLIFNALAFDTEAEAEEAVAFLADNDLTGFAPSEITSGASDNLKGAAQ